MKHLMRKPMLPLLLLAVMVFGTAFTTFFQADIAAGWAQIDQLYADTRITVEIVPEAGWNNLQMKTHKSVIIEGMPEVAETLSVMECYYMLRNGEPMPEPDPTVGGCVVETSTIHGTNNLPWLTEYWNLEIQWLESWNPEQFSVTDGVLPCLVRAELLKEAGVNLGGVITISPTNHPQHILSEPAEFELLVVGVYEDGLGRTKEGSIIVPQESFLGEPKLFYYSDMMYRCYYRTYLLRLNPEYNREYDRIEAQLEKILYDLKDFSFDTNARALENAVRPLYQKLQMQELLVMPLSLLLMSAAAVIAVLLGMSMGTEVFLRLMWGEKRLTVFISLGGVVCLWLLICGAMACGAGCLTAGIAFGGSAVQYSMATALLCVLGSAIPLARSCGSNLIKFYQSREGE